VIKKLELFSVDSIGIYGTDYRHREPTHDCRSLCTSVPHIESKALL